MTVKEKYRIVIAEDHILFRAGLIALLATRAAYEVVGDTGGGLEAIRLAEKTQPDLVLLDLSMSRTNGLEAIKAMKRVSARSRVLILTGHQTIDHVFAALQAGADGYILKDSDSEELFQAIQSVLTGNRYLSPSTINTVVSRYLDSARPAPDPPSTFDGLSTREREILKLIAEGYKTREMAEYLCLSPKTVEKHRTSLMGRLNLHRISALTAYAIEKGLVSK